MTQQPYGYPPQQPAQFTQSGYPQQPAAQPAYPQAPGQPQYPAAQPPYPAQQYPAPQYAQQAPAAQPPYPAQQYPAPQYAQQAPAAQPPALANGGLDEFYSQPNTGGGPGVSWKGKPDGYTVQGIVPRDVTDADITQEVGAPNTQQAGIPQFYRDGRPKYVMAVPLQVQPSQEYPEGEARLFVRGQLRDELARAMSEAQATGAPKAGAVITVTLVQRKQGRGTIPMNVFGVVYTPAGGQAPQGVASPQPPAQQFPSQEAAPQWAQPQPQGQPQLAQQPQYQAPVQQQQPAEQPVQPQAPQQAAPQGPAQSAPQAPAGMSPEQQQLLAQLTGQPVQQQGAPAA